MFNAVIQPPVLALLTVQGGAEADAPGPLIQSLPAGRPRSHGTKDRPRPRRQASLPRRVRKPARRRKPDHYPKVTQKT